jgi:HlyD family secretion protein
MRSNPSRQLSPKAFRHGGILSGLIVTVAIFGFLGAGGYWFWQRSQNNAVRTDLIVDKVSRGSFDHIVLEQGELESSSNVDIICQVRARTGGAGTPILWVVDEGTAVKAGDKLVELDDSAWKTALRDKRIVVIGAEAQVAAAEAAVEQAKISRQEYLEGLFETEERAIQSEMAIAEQQLRKSQLALQSSERLVARGLVKSLQLEADQFAVANSRNMLEAAENRLRVLQNLTRQRMLVEFDSAIDSAEAQLAAALGSLEEEQTDLRDIQKQIELCTMYAPADGIVIHANTFSSRGGSSEVVIEPGSIIRERQTIIRLPDPRRMQVRAKVNESRITLIQPGMPAKIRVGSINNLELLGRVVKVNRYAEPGSWYSSSIKEYATVVEIVDPPDTIRTGMTAEVQIFVEQLPSALQVPIQAIYEHGGRTYSLVRTGERSYETREVVIGATNENKATILNGVDENETVVLNLRQNLSLMDLPEIKPNEDTMLARMVTDSTADPAVANGVATGPSSRGPVSESERPGRNPDEPGGIDSRPDGPREPRGDRQPRGAEPAGEPEGARPRDRSYPAGPGGEAGRGSRSEVTTVRPSIAERISAIRADSSQPTIPRSSGSDAGE